MHKKPVCVKGYVAHVWKSSFDTNPLRPTPIDDGVESVPKTERRGIVWRGISIYLNKGNMMK